MAIATDFRRHYAPHYRRIVKLGWPILLGQLGLIVVTFADNIMVGRYTTEALAAASFVNNVFNAAMMSILGFTYGVTPVVGELYARGKHDEIGSFLRCSMVVNLAFALAVTAIMCGVYVALPRMGQPEELLPLIRPYFLLYLAGLLPMCIFNVWAQWSYGVSDTRTPTWIVLGANLFNILGNYVLIYGHWGAPELGLTGAGIATLVARLLCPLLLGLFFFRSAANKVYARAMMRARATLRESARVLKGSLPLALQMACETAAFSGAAVMAGWLGKDELAAFQIVVVVGMLGFCIYYSIGSATSVCVAQARGSGTPGLMRRCAWAGYHVLLVFMACSCLIFGFFGKELMGAFTQDPAVLAFSASLIFPMILYQLGDATQISFANSLRGTGNVAPMSWIAVFCYLVAGLPSTYLLAFTLGLRLRGIVLSFSVSLFLAGAAFLVTFLHTTRRKL